MPTKRKKVPLLPELDQQTCTGCESCATICPTKCISTMDGPRPDFAPQVCVISMDQCIGCKLCAQVCPWDCITMNPATDRALLKAG